MKKFKQLTVSGILLSVLALGLAGCGNNTNHNTSSSSSKDKTSKVVKKKTTTKKKQAATKSSSSASNSSAVTTENSSSVSSSSSSTTSKQRQLGLGDTATWTDSNGVTHHVDSDGMDRQTIAGSSQVNYADWSGPLPSNAQINRN
ncbi:hypothetical protein FD27_GL001315 [Limosilactobacillus frumenti DSM 13145]|uniref:Lipoprotein n=1 Tax=Limosilactobacillus frumenti DSM 13145 TaxID=1423746 RepID=A0A0R1P188_9LACO|nr:hypothetical protein [Limosilactobacillus frumenti]KRL26177.1 hypothetical protein FD27_GL001315 [Limosilactobacillus frumenti DSM 13145]MBA2914620.1 hypothetical protein [Limosilactobacillus frumenti]QFG72965.1 hypothetical protein LF145_06380 [Limosilactobacillus frumenti]